MQTYKRRIEIYNNSQEIRVHALLREGVQFLAIRNNQGMDW
jgi:hypothetical protein